MSKSHSSSAFILSLDIARESSTDEQVQSSRRTPVSPCKCCQSSEDQNRSQNNTQLYLCLITISCPTYTSAGVSTKSLRNNIRAQLTQTR